MMARAAGFTGSVLLRQRPGRSYCTTPLDRPNGMGGRVRNRGTAPAPHAILARESCGHVRDSTVLPVTTTVTGRLAGIPASSEAKAPTARRPAPARALGPSPGRVALATLTSVRR